MILESEEILDAGQFASKTWEVEIPTSHDIVVRYVREYGYSGYVAAGVLAIKAIRSVVVRSLCAADSPVRIPALRCATCDMCAVVEAAARPVTFTFAGAALAVHVSA